MAVNRLTRLNELLRRELGLAFEMYISPAVKGALVTVTGVELTQELRDATVYVSVYGDESKQNLVMDLLQKKRALLQSQIAANITMRFTPRLQFKLDHTAEKAAKVMTILNELGFDNEPAKPGDSKPEGTAESTTEAPQA